MPSEPARRSEALPAAPDAQRDANGGARPSAGAGRSGAEGRFWRLLRSQGLGLVCGQATVLLLALGSVVMAATREGASAGIALDDVRPFFTRPSWVHLWFYVLLPVLALYGVNTLAATWHSVTNRWRAGIRAPSAYGPSVIHVAFLVALLAHGFGGLFGRETGVVEVGRTWTDLGEGRAARLESLSTETWPNGQPRQIHARLSVREADGRLGEETVAYNHPLSRDGSTDLHLLLRPGRTLERAVVRAGPDTCRLAPGAGCEAGGRLVRLLGVRDTGRGPVIFLELGPGGRTVALPPGAPRRVDGVRLSVEDLEVGPAVLLRGRHAPGTPWALVSAVLLAVGLGLMARRFA